MTLKCRHTSFSRFFSIFAWFSELWKHAFLSISPSHELPFHLASITKLTLSRVTVGMKDTRGTSEFVICPYLAKSSFPRCVFEHFLIDSRSTVTRSAQEFIILTGSMLFSIMQVTNCSRVAGSSMTSMEHACMIFALHSIGPCWHVNAYPSLPFVVWNQAYV